MNNALIHPPLNVNGGDLRLKALLRKDTRFNHYSFNSFPIKVQSSANLKTVAYNYLPSAFSKSCEISGNIILVSAEVTKPMPWSWS